MYTHTFIFKHVHQAVPSFTIFSAEQIKKTQISTRRFNASVNSTIKIVGSMIVSDFRHTHRNRDTRTHTQNHIHSNAC